MPEDPNIPMSICKLSTLQSERVRAQAHADKCVADTLRARAALDQAIAEEATALASLDHRNAEVKQAEAILRRGS